jgi:hypothetical protein
LTDWGTVNYHDNTSLYIKYTIENIGSETVSVGNSLFNVYADDYHVGVSYAHNYEFGETVSGDISSGRKMDGALYYDVNPANVTVIELECGGEVFVIKDDNISDADSEGEVTALSEKDLSGTDIPSDMKVDSKEIDSSELSGYYGGTLGQSSISMYMYSSPDGVAVGYAEVYVEGGQYFYVGEIGELKTNVYKVATDTGEDVLLGLYKQDDEIMIQLYVDGQFIEEYLMGERYES